MQLRIILLFPCITSSSMPCKPNHVVCTVCRSLNMTIYLNTVYFLAIPNYTHIRDKKPLSLEDLMLCIEGGSYMQGIARGEEKPGT